ncbi:MAG: sensor histidine kinase [Woeseiaceae bacterium]
MRRPSQIALALDRESQVLFVNRDLAGTGFPGIKDESRGTLHKLLHPDCDGECRFNSLLRKAWRTLEGERASVEWEIEDPVWDGYLRLSLFRPLTSTEVEVERRRRFALMTVTDLTEIRREYQSVLSNNEQLRRRIGELESALGRPDRKTTDTGAAANEAAASPPASAGAQIIAAQERERHRIASDLHDGVAQSLGVLKFGMETQIVSLKRLHPDLDLAGLEQLVEQMHEMLAELRKISRDLSPAVVNQFGICTAIDLLCKEFHDGIAAIDVQCLTCVQETALPDTVHVAIYRVVQEALNNASKHAAASHIKVRLAADDGTVALDITDDGDGFDTSKPATGVGKGLGLDSMRERVEVTGGHFDIRSAPGQGTRIIASWPESSLNLL